MPAARVNSFLGYRIVPNSVCCVLSRYAFVLVQRRTLSLWEVRNLA